MKKKVFIIIIVSLLAIFMIGRITYKLTHQWQIEVTSDYINVRADATTGSAITGKVEKGEKLKVIRVVTSDYYYYWYYVKVNNYRRGWVASAKNNPFVNEYNAPKDYKAPIVKYNEEVYVTKNLNTITYDHLFIQEDSKYTIKNEIRQDGNLYWITYIVTDKYGNETKKVQRIEFTDYE